MAYGKRTYNAGFTRDLQKSLSWAESNQLPALIPISSRSILILSSHLHLGFSKSLFPVGTDPHNARNLTFRGIDSPHVRETWRLQVLTPHMCAKHDVYRYWLSTCAQNMTFTGTDSPHVRETWRLQVLTPHMCEKHEVCRYWLTTCARNMTIAGTDSPHVREKWRLQVQIPHMCAKHDV
jgi:hypothetical protein